MPDFSDSRPIFCQNFLTQNQPKCTITQCFVLGVHTKRGVALNEESALIEVVPYIILTILKLFIFLSACMASRTLRGFVEEFSLVCVKSHFFTLDSVTRSKKSLISLQNAEGGISGFEMKIRQDYSPDPYWIISKALVSAAQLSGAHFL